MKIKVTQTNIDEGNPYHCKLCPIALAILDSGFAEAVVDTEFAEIFSKEAEFKRYLLSRSAQRFIKRFDTGKEVKPFSFVMKEE